jgi:hypothetical protein
MNREPKGLAISVVLDATAIAGVRVPRGRSHSRLCIAFGRKRCTADVNSDALKRCIASVDEYGPAGVTVRLEGYLESNVIADAAITTEIKRPVAADAVSS